MFWHDTRFLDDKEFCSAAANSDQRQAMITEHFKAIAKPALHVLPDISIRSTGMETETKNKIKSFRETEMKALQKKQTEDCATFFQSVNASKQNLKDNLESMHAYVAFAPDDVTYEKTEASKMIEDFNTLAGKIVEAAPKPDSLKIGSCDADCLIGEMNSVKQRLVPDEKTGTLTGRRINAAVKQLIGMLRIIVSS